MDNAARAHHEEWGIIMSGGFSGLDTDFTVTRNAEDFEDFALVPGQIQKRNNVVSKRVKSSTMGDYHTPGQRTMEIILPKGHIIPPEGCIILPEGCRRPQVEAARRQDNASPKVE